MLYWYLNLRVFGGEIVIFFFFLWEYVFMFIVDWSDGRVIIMLFD